MRQNRVFAVDDIELSFELHFLDRQRFELPAVNLGLRGKFRHERDADAGFNQFFNRFERWQFDDPFRRLGRVACRAQPLPLQ